LIADLVAKLIANGTPADVAAMVVTEAFALGVAVNSGGIPPDSAAEKRRAYDRDRKRNSTGIPPESTGIPKDASISKDLKKDSKRQNRGTRIASEWILSDAERGFAKQEGFSDWEIQREAQKFRDYWTACAGSKGVKLDWSATWRQWIRSGADRSGKAPSPAPTAAAVTAAMDWEKILTSYKKFGHWSKYAGPDPASPACLCPKEMLEKHGIAVGQQQPAAPLLRGMQ
jgi:hypothetical protein